MFTQLRVDYKKRIIWEWRKTLYEQLMVIDTSDRPKETLTNDPYEEVFLRDTEDSTAAKPSLGSPSPGLPDGHRYITF